MTEEAESATLAPGSEQQAGAGRPESGEPGAPNGKPLSSAEAIGPQGPGGIRDFYSVVRRSPAWLLVSLAALAIVLYGMKHAQSILGPILLAMFIVMGLSPVLGWLKRRRVPPWAAIALVMLLFVVIGLLIGGILASSLSQVNTKLPVYQQNLGEMYSDLESWFGSHGMDISGLTESVFSPAKIFSWATTSASYLISQLTSVFLILLIVIFMVAEAYSFPRKFHDRAQFSPQLYANFANFAKVTRTFLFTLTWLNLLTAILAAIIYYAFGVDFALLWAIVFFLLSYIPNIGFVLSVIPPFFVTLLEQGFTRAVIVVVLVIAVNGFVNNAITPRFMGYKTGLTTLIVFLSLVLWAWVLGPVGALMSVPLMLMVKLLFFDQYETTRPISALITPLPRSKEPRWRRRRRG